MPAKIWFITGASRGIGREWTIAALERGDNVAATARDTSTLDDLGAKYGEALLPLQLDVTDRDADLAAVRRAHDHFGRLDVIVNNAGYGQFGMVEELSEADIRQQLETNLFGALWITQAALPFLRAQGSGHILQVSSIGGISAFQNVGAYHASKWALEGISQSLAQEVAGFGIKVTIIEPGVTPPTGAAAQPSTQRHWPPTTRCVSRPPTGPAGAVPPEIRLRPGKPCSRWWTLPTHPCASSSVPRRWPSRPPTTSPG